MKVELLEIGKIKEKDLKFAVISASFQEKWIFVKHKQRDTWEIPGGHREIGEDINNTAKRELSEETGAKTFRIKPICDYSVMRDDEVSYGRLFYAEIEALGELPDMEIEKVKLFDMLPEKLTYPEIQPFLYRKVLKEKMKEYLGKKVKVFIDRPLGSKHPNYGFVYPINYGYLSNTVSGDGEEIDAYVIGEFEPLKSYEGYVIAIIYRKNDVEDKLVVCRDLNMYNKAQIRALVDFQERFFEVEIIMTRA
ncbi:NUDIX domain-containing protein [Paramaledivibacter caminithermalis]|jgi:nucleoside triphosphatase YtkD|uniref:inorganic diphosphatase n=1 Tax=Paramaledivibacter caminithermalis (strain DSM 15212 / CIP 107654 / DViRD3) TaxID=1121301 RepID=A0A1M6QFZ6_PARC5|nr:NUDIX domain-containing protein [Paramaledivibacter caminithermalis]SHK19030.1 nucleoside triphosphatase YtkD [Paramaledivibacter caminithermalis DSM 15212]